MLLFWHHRKDKEHSSNKLYICGNLCLMFFWATHRKCEWIFCVQGNVPVLPHVEVAISEPKTVFDLNVDCPLAFQKSNCSYPISSFDVVLKGGHLLDLYFVIHALFWCWAFNFGFWYWSSWAIHFKNIKFKSNYDPQSMFIKYMNRQRKIICKVQIKKFYQSLNSLFLCFIFILRWFFINSQRIAFWC